MRMAASGFSKYFSHNEFVSYIYVTSVFNFLRWMLTVKKIGRSLILYTFRYHAKRCFLEKMKKKIIWHLQSVTKIIETRYIFIKKILKKYLTCLKQGGLNRTCSKIPKIPPPPWHSIAPGLKKLCQAVLVRNEQANLQPTLNKGAGGASLTIFVRVKGATKLHFTHYSCEVILLFNTGLF